MTRTPARVAARAREAIGAEINNTVVRRIDENDNGVTVSSDDRLGLPSLVKDCNPGLNAVQSDAAKQSSVPLRPAS